MDLVTSSVYAPGATPGAAFLDQILILPRFGLLAVADAPVGKDDGRAGVRIALDAVRNHVERNEDILKRFRRHPSDDLRERLLQIVEECFGRAAQEVFAFARRREGLVVTLDLVLLVEHEAFVGHVGDGRVYLVRRGLLHQLTVDHARSEEAEVFDGEEQVGEVVDAGDRHFTRMLGPHPRVRVESLCTELNPSDRFVVTTAHMHRAIPESVLNRHLIAESLDALGPALARRAGSSPLIAAAAQAGDGDPSRPDSARDRLAKLEPMPMFTHCTERELRTVAAATRPRRAAEGTRIFTEGDPGTEVYLLITGEVRIERGGHHMITLGDGSNFGEMAMLDEPLRSATATAATDCELLVIPRDAFFAMLRGNPMLAVKILWNMLLRLSANLRQTSARLAELPPVAPPAEE